VKADAAGPATSSRIHFRFRASVVPGLRPDGDPADGRNPGQPGVICGQRGKEYGGYRLP